MTPPRLLVLLVVVGNEGGDCGVTEIAALLPKVVVFLMMVIAMVIAMVTDERFSVEC